MALSTNTFPYNGGAQTFTLSLSLGYLEESDIRAFVVGDLTGGGDQIYRAFTFDSEFVVRLTDPLTIGDEVTVERTVSKTSFVVDFETGGDVTARNLMILYKQVFMAQQELLDGRVGDFDPTGDAASAEASAVAAAVSADEAAASAIEAAGFEPSTFYTKVEADVIHGLQYTKVEQDIIDGDQDTAVATALGLKAPLADAALTGSPTAETPTAGDNSTRLATTEFVTESGSKGKIVASTVFEAGGTWTKHADSTSAMIYATGGGEGGEVGSGQQYGGRGGRSAWTIIHFVADTQALGDQTVTIGSGGASSLVDGGDTTVGSIVLAPGGGLSAHGTPLGTLHLEGGEGSARDVAFGDSTGGMGGVGYWGCRPAYGGGGFGGSDGVPGDVGATGVVFIVEYG